MKFKFFYIILLYIGFSVNFSGCDNSGGPESLSYANPDAVYTRDGRIIDNIPSVKGSVTRWGVEPMLPVGIAMDPRTGIISGAPVAVQERKTYTVTASNSRGAVSAEISITVNIAPPGTLTYLHTDAIYNEGGSIINNFPSVTGSGIQFSISPSLPVGLSLDANTGVIWGTPSAASVRTEYTVTAANSSGSVSAVIYITVTVSNAPSGLVYSSPVSVYTAGHAISGNVPSVNGSGITFSADPALPAGLSIDPVTGIISGMPVSSQGASNYTVTALNAKGSTTAVLSIAVSADALLSSLSVSAGTIYPDFNPFTYSYTVRLPLNTASVTVTPAASDSAFAAISVNGSTVLTGQASGSITMNPGENMLSIIVTAGDTVTTKTYTLRAVRGFLPDAYVKSGNSASMDRFGQSVAISGDTLVVGSPYESSGQRGITSGTATPADISGPGSGAVYVYRKTGGLWAQEAYIKASNADADDNFGSSVAIDGDVIAVGAPREDSGQRSVTNGADAGSDNSSNASGAVYVFRRTGTAWAQEAYLKASNADPNDEFGRSVGISGDTIVVGAYLEDSNQNVITNGATASSNNTNTSSGAAYVFRRTSGVWDQEAYLKAANNDSLGDYFGSSVSISGDTIVVGAYHEDSNQSTITNGATASSDNSFTASGTAYVYKRIGTEWTQEAYLKASNNVNYSEYFGNSVAISGDTIVVGAYYEGSNQTTITNGTGSSSIHSARGTGAAYVYKRTANTWAQEAYLKAVNGETNPVSDYGDHFGYKVAIYEDTIAVSAFYEASSQKTCSYGNSASSDNSAARAGAVYVFKRSGITWSNDSYLKAPNSDTYDYFGTSLAIWGNTIIAGAPVESGSQKGITNEITAPGDNNSYESGAVYIFTE